MKRLITLLAITLVLGCAKSTQESKIVVCPEAGTWLSTKVKEYESCTCLTVVSKGTFNKVPVILIAIVDPLCNGINIIYKEDGTELTTSADAAGYKAVIDAVSDFKEIWRCSKAK